MNFILDKFKYAFIFLFSFLVMSILMTYFDGDVLWNYGFSYAISQGEVPYRDFNMILTPLYPFLMSIGLLFNSNILVFYIENSLLIALMFYFLFKMYKDKAWLFLLFLVFPIPVVVYPSYNLFLLFLLVLLFYLEENNKSDYLIGSILGLMVLTKQTVGVAVLLVGLIYYFKDVKKAGKRVIGFIIPCLIFLMYLISTGSFSYFLDYCLFGLFDFTSSNTNLNLFFLIISIILLGYVIYLITKDKKSIFNYYLLAFYIIVVPLFDISHIIYYLFALLLLLLKKDFKFDKKIIKYYLIFICFYVGIFFYSTMYNGFIYPNHYNNFNYRVLYNKNGENKIRDQVISFINKNKDTNRIVILGSDAYFYKITCNMKIDEFDLFNYGNHGYNGKNKMKNKINDLPSGTIMIIDNNGSFSSPQFMEEVSLYAKTLGDEVNKIGNYVIYKKK